MDDIDETPLPEHRLAKAWYKFPYSGDDQKRADFAVRLQHMEP